MHSAPHAAFLTWNAPFFGHTPTQITMRKNGALQGENAPFCDHRQTLVIVTRWCMRTCTPTTSRFCPRPAKRGRCPKGGGGTFLVDCAMDGGSPPPSRCASHLPRFAGRGQESSLSTRFVRMHLKWCNPRGDCTLRPPYGDLMCIKPTKQDVLDAFWCRLCLSQSADRL
jgi:hypothetical protein